MRYVNSTTLKKNCQIGLVDSTRALQLSIHYAVILSNPPLLPSLKNYSANKFTTLKKISANQKSTKSK